MATDMAAYGIYPDRESFQRALEALRSAGFRNSDVSAILPDPDRTWRDLAHEVTIDAPHLEKLRGGDQSDRPGSLLANVPASRWRAARIRSGPRAPSDDHSSDRAGRRAEGALSPARARRFVSPGH
jgi:hypothetical protein